MNYQEYQDLKASIINDTELTEVITKTKLIDDDGEQMLVSKVEQASINGTITQEYNYSGGTRDFALQSITEYIVLPDTTRIDEVIPQ